MSELNLNQFLKVVSEFKLGNLTTESFHPLTKNLSFDVNSNLSLAIDSLKQVDILALNKLLDHIDEIYSLFLAVQEREIKKGRIFLCGCGATGRLSLAIETFARSEGKDNIIGFMAGGDFALIKSVESFEDRMSYGSRQLLELGFTENDLLIAITEGGETSFVIGAALEAAKISSVSPYFLYCNPDEQLLHLERCHSVLTNPTIKKICLNVGAMALSGSTRMQATTVQMFVVGVAILSKGETNEVDFKKYVKDFILDLVELNYSALERFIDLEAANYLNNGHMTYVSDENLALTILTDTTERSPTFSLAPFEEVDSSHFSLCYLTIDKTDNALHAWETLLKRKPRTLDWAILNGMVNDIKVLSFDMSKNSIERRSKLNSHKLFTIKLIPDEGIEFKVDEHISLFRIKTDDILFYQLSLKLLMNTMSTLIMGKLGRYQSNMMTWVRPSNFKLIDRATRYVDELLKKDGIYKEYKDIARVVLELSPLINNHESIVLAVYRQLIKN